MEIIFAANNLIFGCQEYFSGRPIKFDFPSTALCGDKIMKHYFLPLDRKVAHVIKQHDRNEIL